jgi:NADP-dependent aldehyde dehydrogenase
LPSALEQRCEAIAAGLHASVTLGVGQFCTNPGLIFVQDTTSAQVFLRQLKERMAATPPGAMLTADICAAYHSGVEKFSKVPNVECLTPGALVSGSNQVRATLFVTDARTFLANPVLMDEVFGPSTLIVRCQSDAQLLELAQRLEGQLTATVHGTPEELGSMRDLVAILQTKVGRLVFNSFPTGVEVCHAMVHGGPYPATADGRSTSVGTRAIQRFARPVCYQGFPDSAFTNELKEGNPLGIWRLVDGKFGQR